MILNFFFFFLLDLRAALCSLCYLTALKKIILFIYFFTLLGLCGCVGFSLAVTSRGYSLVVVSGLLIAVASLVAVPGL